jgi:hypothetical protein
MFTPILITASSAASGFTDANALSSLLTVESLLFAAIGASISLSNTGTWVRDLPISARALGFFACGFLSLVAVGGVLSWTIIFGDHWPCDARRAIIALILLVAIVGQPILAWVIAKGLGRKQ